MTIDSCGPCPEDAVTVRLSGGGCGFGAPWVLGYTRPAASPLAVPFRGQDPTFNVMAGFVGALLAAPKS
ncbi:MAG: hypothetical protein ACRD18_03675, partial [Terriglobia bacterium]